MRKKLLVLALSSSLFSTAQAAQLTTYLTEWSGYSGPGDYPAYAFDGSYPNSYGNFTSVKNADMVAKAQKSDVLAFAFFQVWNQDLINQYAGQAKPSWLGVLHFDDLWGNLPSLNNKNSDQSMWSSLCAANGSGFADGTCSAVQMNGMTGKMQVFNYTTSDVGQMDNFGAFLKLNTEATKIISIGGANTLSNGSVSTKTFQTIFANQATFLTSLSAFITHLQGHGFTAKSGVDYDFEPPINADGSQIAPNAQTTQDYKNLYDLVVATRQKLGSDAYISVTITANEDYLDAINASVDGGWFKQIQSYASAVNIMTYDLHGPWSSSADPGAISHIMLKQPSNLQNAYAINYATQEVMTKVVGYGADPKKLQLGLASYGRGFGGVSAGSNAAVPGFDQGWNSAASLPSQYSNQQGMLPYKFVSNLESEQGYKPYNVVENNTVIASYLYSDSLQQLIGYMSPELLNTTCNYLKGQGLQGAILWSADTDAVDGDSSLISQYDQNCRDHQ